jgi:hypothetical protein
MAAEFVTPLHREPVRRPRSQARPRRCACVALEMSGPEPPRRPVPPGQEPTEPLGGPVPSRRPRPAEERVPEPYQPVAAYEPAPPPGPWRESPWPPIVVGLIALIAGGLIGYVIGNSNEGERRPGATVTQTATVTQPKVVTSTVTQSTVKETAAPANQANEERRREAESNLRKAEKENQELKHQLEEAGRSP